MEEQARVRISELVKVCPDIGQKGIREMKKMRYNLGKNAQKQSFWKIEYTKILTKPILDI